MICYRFPNWDMCDFLVRVVAALISYIYQAKHPLLDMHRYDQMGELPTVDPLDS